MYKTVAIGLVVGALMACGNSQSPASQTSPPAQQPQQPKPAQQPQQVELKTIDAGTLQASPQDAAVPPVDAAPAVPLEQSKAWPFYRWDRAQSYTFNLRGPGPGAKLRIYTEKQGWTEGPIEGPMLSKAQAKTALGLVAKTQGQMIVSKCPFPRHGIVFFQGETPVASVSVCFECGDIMVWPAYSQAANWEQQKSRRFGKLMKGYKRAFPRWEKLFETELSLAKDWTKLPKKAP